MRKPDERGELIQAVQRGEAVTTAAARLGVPASTAYRWLRAAAARARLAPTPTFVEVVAERAVGSAILVRVGAAEIEVRAGFDARLLREVARALGDEA
jgi:transposase-like protein